MTIDRQLHLNYLHIMRNKSKRVSGVGINDLDHPVYVDGSNLLSYDAWASMLKRCYSTKLHSRMPKYIGCSVCEEWKYFSVFEKWYDENYKEGFELDKDILVEGNKVYSPDTCRFVPKYLNTLLNIRILIRDNLPLGVYRNGKTYIGQCNNGHGRSLTKTFKTIEEAQAWYSATKKRIVKEQAIRAFLDNAIKTDVYLALVRREF